jgi:hypothetical protein
MKKKKKKKKKKNRTKCIRRGTESGAAAMAWQTISKYKQC